MSLGHAHHGGGAMARDESLWFGPGQALVTAAGVGFGAAAGHLGDPPHVFTAIGLFALAVLTVGAGQAFYRPGGVRADTVGVVGVGLHCCVVMAAEPFLDVPGTFAGLVGKAAWVAPLLVAAMWFARRRLWWAAPADGPCGPGVSQTGGPPSGGAGMMLLPPSAAGGEGSAVRLPCKRRAPATMPCPSGSRQVVQPAGGRRWGVTERDGLSASNPMPLLSCLDDVASGRKLRLLGCAICRLPGDRAADSTRLGVVCHRRGCT